MHNIPILSTLIFLPIAGAILIKLLISVKDNSLRCNCFNMALWVSLANFLVSLYLLYGFDKTYGGFQFTENFSWLEGYNISYHLGIDGISIYLVILTTFIMPIAILSSKEVIKDRFKEYVILFLVMESLMIGVFCALDLLLFYFFFEAILIPMFLIIGIWGGERRIYASFKFFLYTLLGSLFFLIAIVYIYKQHDTLDIPALMAIMPKTDITIQEYLWFAIFLSFAVKVPMWPVHTWLPDAHVQAPTAGSVVLAGILLKMGAYGFLRFSLPMLPAASQHFAPFIYTLSGVAIIYASLVAFAQKDMKKLIAYSSVAHMGYVTMGIFSFNIEGIEGAIYQILSHGIVSAALFLCVGVLYDRMHTKLIAKYGGVAHIMPYFALYFMVYTMASVGLPSTSGFIGEFMVMVGIYKVNKLFGIVTATGVVFGAIYMLWLYKKVMFGGVENNEVKDMQDLSKREHVILLPLALLAIILGVYPSIITDYMHSAVLRITNIF